MNIFAKIFVGCLLGALVMLTCSGCDGCAGVFSQTSSAAGVDDQRPPKIHRAGERQRQPPSTSRTTIEKGSPTRQRIFTILKQLRSQTTYESRKDQASYITTLMAAMADEALGDRDTRREVAEALVEMMIGEVELRPLDNVNDVALWRMASTFDDATRQLIWEWTDSESDKDDGAHRLKKHIVPTLKTVEGHQEITWQQVGGWTYHPDQPIPSEILALDGQRVTLGGFMIDLDYSDDNKVYLFLLVESLWDCCFGEPPTIEQGIIVTVPGGVSWTEGPLQVSGVLDVGEFLQDGELIGLFRMTTQQVESLKPSTQSHATSP